MILHCLYRTDPLDTCRMRLDLACLDIDLQDIQYSQFYPWILDTDR